KRSSSLNTLVGAVPGAIPTVMGWTAGTGALAPEAVALFTILFIWQMPHFLAIAILYREDYRAGGFKMLPVIDRDLGFTCGQIMLYTLTLVLATLVAVPLRMAGTVYLVGALILGAAFLATGVKLAMTKSRV